MLKWCLFAAVTAHLSALAFGLPVAGEDVPDDSIGVRISQASVHVPGSPADTVGSFGTQYHNVSTGAAVYSYLPPWLVLTPSQKQNMSPEQHASYEAIREIVQRARHDGLVEDDFLDVVCTSRSSSSCRPLFFFWPASCLKSISEMSPP